MNTKLLAITLCAMPLATVAQTNINAAFDRITQNRQAKVTASHHIEKDPITGAKISQYAVYKFTIPTDSITLIRNVEKAFSDDFDDAYSFSTGVQSTGSQPLTMAAGDYGDGVIMARNPGDTYYFACFLDPEDPEHIHRYAYAMDWNTDGEIITGTLAMTYSTTLAYRQRQAAKAQPQPTATPDPASPMPFFDPIFVNMYPTEQPTWISQFVFLTSCMDGTDLPTCRAIAGRLYELSTIANQYNVPSQEIEIAREVVTSLINEPIFADKMTHSLLTSTAENLK